MSSPLERIVVKISRSRDKEDTIHKSTYASDRDPGGKIDFMCVLEHFVDHLAPIWVGLHKVGAAGGFHIPEKLRERAILDGVPAIFHVYDQQPTNLLVVVASIGDVRRCPAGKHLALVEHGCGLSWIPSYEKPRRAPNHSGGGGIRNRVELFLMTNEWCAKWDRIEHPKSRVEIVGAPKLDWVTSHEFVRNDPPVIAYATHWDCFTVPETRSAFPWFQRAVQNLSKRYTIVGHAHPRAIEPWKYYARWGIQVERVLSEVLKKADLFIGDGGSGPYEFAATGKPVVVCNAPIYRRDVHHGLRFWQAIPGIQCDTSEQLEACVATALVDPPELRRLREHAISTVYPFLGTATERATSILLEWRG